jgi:hypothetical protein
MKWAQADDGDMRHRIVLTSDAEAHLRLLTARQRATVADGMERQWVYEPTRETRNWKRMKPNLIATWELRIENLRVYYRVASGPEPKAVVVALGVKVGNRVWVGNEELIP